MKIHLNGKVRGIGFYIIIIAVLISTVGMLMNQKQEKKVVYSDIVHYFEAGQVDKFTINGTKLVAQLKDNKVVSFTLPSVDIFLYDVGDLIKKQRASGVIKQYNFEPEVSMPWWASLMPYLLLIFVFGLFWYFMLGRGGDGGAGPRGAMSFGRSRAKLVSEDAKKTTFKDVAGADEEKAELQEIVEFLKSPRKFIEIGARIPKGVLLVGPPGTGKTLIARAVAGEAGVPFLTISGSDFVELYVGVGASRVRDLFDQAKKNAPAIVFIDEIDAVGRHRGAGLGGGHDEREQTLNQLLVEMDGFGKNEGVIVIAATNRADILDPALLRPGRFDRQVFVGLPDIKGREEILKVHARNKIFEEGVKFTSIAKTTAGFTGADLENLLNEAALLAARRSKKKISMAEMDDAFIKVIMGTEKKSRVISEKERKLTAYHEAGHAIITRLLPTQDPVHQISIIPRGRAGGYTLSLPKEDKYYASKSEMLDEILVFLGGRVAEKITLDDISTGASNDIERASELVRKMVTRYGMSDEIGPIAFGSVHDEVFMGRDFGSSKNFSEETGAMIDREVKAMIEKAYAECEKLLRENMDKLRNVAEYLIHNETMDGEVFEKIFNGEKVENPTETKETAEPKEQDFQNVQSDENQMFFNQDQL
ncbi:MAG: ATP-dependent zinc metalloprotease FtsH [Clostridiales bacterium]|nr:ATP-dependent zinc metalloprotease FtsH [Clostridiales bacterium]